MCVYVRVRACADRDQWRPWAVQALCRGAFLRQPPELTLSSCSFHLANMRVHFEMRMMDQTVGSRAVSYQADKDLEVHNDRVAKCFWLEEVRREYAVEKRQRGAISSVTFPLCFKIYVCESVFVCACLYTMWVPEEDTSFPGTRVAGVWATMWVLGAELGSSERKRNKCSLTIMPSLHMILHF